nr:protein strawberry notch-like isoform X2 [Drosophila kikkawai]
MRNTESEEVVNMNDKAGFIRDAKEKEEKAKVDKEKEEKEKEKVEMVNQNREREYVGTEDKENENKLNEDKKNEDKKNEDKKNGDTKNENKNKKNDDKENENKKNEIENKKNEIENKKNENENKKNEDKENENKKNEDKENENRKTENENTKNKNKENENENKKNEDKKNENKNNSDKKTDNKDTKDKKTKKHNAHQNTQDHKASSIQVARNATTDFYTFCTTTTSDVMNAALFDIELACSLKEELLRKIDYLGKRLPPNSLDHLIDELGGPENVAELTSRRGRIVQHKEGAIKYDWHVPLKTHNLDERRMFMNGLKNVAIISEPATSAWNLHSDRRERNKRRRVHITLELPWSTDMAIQQLGRTHRCNQVFTPEYIFLTTDLAGEQHFASALAKRLQTMGGHCVRRTKTTRDLSQFHIDNKYGLQALEKMMLTIMGYEMPLVPPPTDYSGEFFKDIAGALVGVGIIVNSESHPGVLSLDKDYNNISKFLNRILGCPVDLQNRLFKYFTDTITAIIQQAKRGGRFYLGIVDLGAPGRKVNRLRHLRFWRQHATGVAPTDLHTVRVEHGMKWRDAQAKYSDAEHDYEGFYLSHRSHNHKHTVIMALVLPSNGMISDSSSSDDSDSPKEKKRSTCNEKEIMCQVYRPNTGLQTRPQSLYELGRKYRKVRMLEAKPHWTEHYNNSMYACSHVFWNGNCGNVTQGNECEVGLRHRSYHILTGYVLCVWNRVEHLLNTVSNSKIQLVRVKTTDDMNIVGTLIPKDCYETLINDLRSDCEEQEEFNYCAGAANLKTDEEKLKYTRQKEEGKEVQEGST